MLLNSMSNIPNLIISYNDTSWGDIDEIVDVVKIYRKKVHLEEFNYFNEQHPAEVLKNSCRNLLAKLLKND